MKTQSLTHAMLQSKLLASKDQSLVPIDLFVRVKSVGQDKF